MIQCGSRNFFSSSLLVKERLYYRILPIIRYYHFNKFDFLFQVTALLNFSVCNKSNSENNLNFISIFIILLLFFLSWIQIFQFLLDERKRNKFNIEFKLSLICIIYTSFFYHSMFCNEILIQQNNYNENIYCELWLIAQNVWITFCYYVQIEHIFRLGLWRISSTTEMCRHVGKIS